MTTSVTLTEAREMLALYIAAEKLCLLNQSYTIKDRTYTRADLATLARVQGGVRGEADGWHPMEAKRALARELVARFHGADAAVKAEEDFIQQFRQKELPDDIPVVTLAAAGPVWICRLLSDAGLVESNGEARRR